MSRNATFATPVPISNFRRNRATMSSRHLSETIKEHPIGQGLDAFRRSFISICEDAGAPCNPQTLQELSQEGKSIHLRFLPSASDIRQNCRISLSTFYQPCKAFAPPVNFLPAATTRIYSATFYDSAPMSTPAASISIVSSLSSRQPSMKLPTITIYGIRSITSLPNPLPHLDQ